MSHVGGVLRAWGHSRHGKDFTATKIRTTSSPWVTVEGWQKVHDQGCTITSGTVPNHIVQDTHDVFAVGHGGGWVGKRFTTRSAPSRLVRCRTTCTSSHSLWVAMEGWRMLHYPGCTVTSGTVGHDGGLANRMCVVPKIYGKQQFIKSISIWPQSPRHGINVCGLSHTRNRVTPVTVKLPCPSRR